jgi:hypothetical protein
MWRRVHWLAFGCIFVAALAALVGCTHYFSGERESWRHDAEAACLNSGTVKEGSGRVRIAAVTGPGICGMDFPLRVSELGESPALGFDDEPERPPSAIPDGALPQHWPLAQPNGQPAAAPPQYGTAQGQPPQSTPRQELRWQVGPVPAASATAGPPLSLYAPGVAVPEPDGEGFQPAPPRPYQNAGQGRPGLGPPTMYPAADYSGQNYPAQNFPPASYPARAYPPPTAGQVPLGPPDRSAIAAAGPVELKPAATLACPIVSALDQWIAVAVQPAALRWFHVPVVEIKQISAYSCRGMNGNPNAHISEHAFGNALDIAGFTLADGHVISVQYGWRGTPEEQGFLHDVQLAACDEFSTVLAPGANIYHYNHIHVDLMRRRSRRRICEPAAIPGEVVAERARARYAAHHYRNLGITGALGTTSQRRALGYDADDDGLPIATPGDD